MGRLLKGDFTWTPEDGPLDEYAHRSAASIKGAFEDAGKDAIDRFELPIDFDFLLPQAADYAEARGAELVGKKWVDGMLVDNPRAEWAITDKTRELVNELLSEALENGSSYQEFASRLEDLSVFDDARAELVARNEIALAMAGGKVAAFKEGDVEYVYIYDGDGDEACQEANGELWTVEEYEANPLEHPNCERDARPATQSELAEEGLADEEQEEEAA